MIRSLRLNMLSMLIDHHGCPHLSIDGFGRCNGCGEWAPFFNPPERASGKRATELSILSANEPGNQESKFDQ